MQHTPRHPANRSKIDDSKYSEKRYSRDHTSHSDVLVTPVRYDRNERIGSTGGTNDDTRKYYVERESVRRRPNHPVINTENFDSKNVDRCVSNLI